MLIIGSQAMRYHGILPEGQEPRDTDIIGTFEEFRQYADNIRQTIGVVRCVPLSAKKFHIRDKLGWNYEFEIAWPESSGELLLEICREEKFAPIHVLYALKMSHRYLRNSPHFLKTMQDIHYLRKLAGAAGEAMVNSPWFKQREEETYTYAHPKLDVSKGEFFDDSVGYVYDHDSIHQAIALGMNPAYTYYMKDGAEVMTCKEKFFAGTNVMRLHGVYEEACVLALERSQVPHNFSPSPRYSFELALMKVCTSITSGWFREFAWENYQKVLDLYEVLGEDDYIQRFKRNKHMLKPFTR